MSDVVSAAGLAFYERQQGEGFADFLRRHSTPKEDGGVIVGSLDRVVEAWKAGGSKPAATVPAAMVQRVTRPPQRMTDEAIALGEQHAAICEKCADQCKGVTRTRAAFGDPAWPLYRVSCKLAGRCGGVPLTVKGNCAAGKW
jgi:hypothetical protein